jgi:hypothetical protein
MIGINPLREGSGDPAEEARAWCGDGLWHKKFDSSERSERRSRKPRFDLYGKIIPN